MNLPFYYQLVENAISKLGVDPATCRREKPGEWSLKCGSAMVYVYVWETQVDYGYVQIIAPVVEVPAEKKLEFYEEILGINHTLYGVGMTRYENWIYIKTVRELQDLSEDEVLGTLKRVGSYADDYDDYLKNKYSGWKA